MRIGAHVSIAGSLDLAIDRAVEIEAECIQVFGSAPQQWQFLLFPEEQIATFKQKAKKHNISPVFVHAIYLINLASENPYILDKSLTSLIQYLEFSSLINAEGVIFHIGSHKGAGWKAVREQVFQAIATILERTGETLGSPQPRQMNTSPRKRLRGVRRFHLGGGGIGEVEELAGFARRGCLILENSAGAGGIIGAKFSELGEIVRAVKDPRLKVCLDTAHAFESGYSLSAGKFQYTSILEKTESLDGTLNEFDAEIGLERLVAIHANDSKTPFASGVDRHENIGRGYIGMEGFRLITHHSRLTPLPFIIETPGFDDRGVDRKNLEVLRRLSEER